MWLMTNELKLESWRNAARRYYWKHHDEICSKKRSAKHRESNRKSYKKNIVIRRPTFATYRKTNRDKIKEYQKSWRKTDTGRLRSCRDASLRRARQRLATVGDLTDIAKIYERCAELRRWFAVEVDHVISLARGGTHEAKNLQIIYDFENRRKHARLDYKPRVIFV
jgi:hypothetical protein